MFHITLSLRRDGFIVIAVITNAFWHSLLDVVDIDCLRDPKFNDQSGRLANQRIY